MADLITQTNQKIFGGISLGGIANFGLWLIAGIIAIAGGFGVWWYYYQRKQWNNLINDFEEIGFQFKHTRSDVAKKVKLGSGGFEVLYLRKAKTYRLAFGSRMDEKKYYFFIGKDGYPYNSVLASGVRYINELGGLIPVVTANPAMRAQYTALEKQIDALHQDKKSFWDSNKTWIIPLIFVLISGMMLWLIAGKVIDAMNVNAGLTDRISTLVDRVNNLLENSKNLPPANNFQQVT